MPMVDVTGTIFVTRESLAVDLAKLSSEMVMRAIARGIGNGVSSDSAAAVAEEYGKGNYNTPEAIAYRDKTRLEIIQSIYDGSWGSEITQGDRMAQLVELWHKRECREGADKKFTRVNNDKGKPIDEWIDGKGHRLSLAKLLDGVYKRTPQRVAAAEQWAAGEYAAEQAKKQAKQTAKVSAGNGADNAVADDEI
jgi:hypothetical protein